MASTIFLPLALLAGLATAQTFSVCDPLNATCPANAALGTTLNETFTASTTALNLDLWNITSGTTAIQFGNNGAELTLTKPGDSITVESNFYINFGRVEMIMQAAAGQGIISTFDLLSDDLDEIDLEIMGGNTSFVESNWYGWGNLSQYNALYHPVNGPQQGLHNYTVIWDAEQVQWIIDGNLARNLPYDKPSLYPQTPSKLKFGIWAGGDAKAEGTVTWAGGKVDWSQAPFTMTVQSILVTDASTNTTTYTYSDRTGAYKSITSTPGISSAAKTLTKPASSSPIASATKSWNGLSRTSKIAIAASVIGVLVLIIIAYSFVCVVQRRKGRAEKRKADEAWEEQMNELSVYRAKMAKGGFAVSHLGHGEKF
ncbi:hypothetical protein LTR62_002122 [Meristemomyces frigidus]|uniref:chitinase n=1 Tax=Meristemomyces frigidus TaxID=1508187 RepID=A0AAN7YKS7_9PEZI|nr:hypothetical protein LTR62_002122 [Meristemomyces frigidus]